MKNVGLIMLIFVLIMGAMSCKQCYQCAVRDSAASDSVVYYYKEVCVTKKDYKAYVAVCEESVANAGGDSAGYHCQCEHDLKIE